MGHIVVARVFYKVSMSRLLVRLSFSRLVFSLSLLFYAGTVSAVTLDEVIVRGNQKTHGKVIKQEMAIRPGDEITQEAIDLSRRAIMDLGLFNYVEIEQEWEDGVSRLIVSVKEKKHDWYILPRIDRNAEGDIALGMNLRANNMNGLHQQLKVTLLYKDFEDATVDQEKRLSVKFGYPRIINTRFSGYTYASVSQSGLDEERQGQVGRYDRTEYVFGLGLGKWFSQTGISRGPHASLGMEYQRFDHDYISGAPDLFDNITEYALIGEVSYRDVHDLLYNRKGFSTGLILSGASDELGSDRSYFRQYAYYRQYISLPWRDYTNFNFQVQMASGDNSLFGGPIYELSGDHSLRGYARETLEGDSYLLVNTQFLTPIFGQKSLRAGLLFDFGNAYEDFSEIGDKGFESGIGVSLRWKLKQWVNTEIRMDYARGLGDEGSSRFYISANELF